MTGSSVAETHELVIEREFNAPRELVFRAWTDQEMMRQWLCPKDFEVTSADGQLRPGGEWRSGMRSPDGTDYVAKGTYQEIDPPKRLVFTHQWEYEDDRTSPLTTITIDLEDLGGRTRMRFAQTGFVAVDARDDHRGGWTEAFDNLATALENNQEPKP